MGVGWCKEEVVSCGYEWESRGQRCDEALDLITQLWTEPVTHHNGKYFQVQQARMDPKPIQTPHIPLIIGGYSAAALKRTAKYGQGWLGFGLTPKMAAPMLHALDGALAAEGRRRADLDIVMMPGDDSLDAAKAFADLGVDRLAPLVSLDEYTTARLNYLEKLSGLFT